MYISSFPRQLLDKEEYYTISLKDLTSLSLTSSPAVAEEDEDLSVLNNSVENMATLSLFAKGYQQPFVQKYFSEYLQTEMTNNNKNIVIPQSFYSFVFATHSFLSL